MYAVGGVDLQARLLLRRMYNLVHPCRAVALLGRIIDLQIVFNGKLRLGEFEVDWLIFFVAQVRQINGAELVERQHAVGFRISDGCAGSRGAE